MQTPSLEWALRACKFARESRPLGSINRRHEGESREREERRLKAEAGVATYHRKYTLQNHDDPFIVREWVDYAVAVKKAEAGNCHAMATLALCYLLYYEVFPLTLVELEDPGDHTFLIVGSDEKYSTIGDMINDHLENWGAGVFICDPWANLACPAARYKIDWQEKMQKWSAHKKQVSYQGEGETRSAWIDPCRQDWYQSVVKHRRVIKLALPKNYEKDSHLKLGRLGFLPAGQ